jgi:RNA polymerase sigma factor (sigma-70 family)
MLFRKFRNTMTLSDGELIQKYKDSEDGYYVGELFKRYTHLVFGVCMKYLKDEEDSKDAVMQVFEKLMDDLKKHEISNFKSWLHSVAKNLCLMKLRKTNREVPLEPVMENSASFVESGEELHLNEKEKQLLHLEEALNCLNDSQRVCVRLFYLEEKSYSQVAEITGFSVNEVKSHLQNGRRNLKNYMTKGNGREKNEI